ncbi:MAG: hypothetical protein GXP26_11845 [Planctomycetes bacterium]|nr:hypothetical protein [Planctomycetota bacterium]
MPATEKTWRNQKVLHIVFGVSTLVMLFATLWLLAKDHNREWKKWQLADRKKDAWMIRAQHDSMADQFSENMDSMAAGIRRAQAANLDATLIEKFKALVSADNERRSEPTDFSALDKAIETLGEAASAAEQASGKVEQAGDEVDASLQREAQKAEDQAISAREKVFAELHEYFTEAMRLEKKIVANRKSVAADRTATVSELGLKVGEGASVAVREKIQTRIDGYTEEIAALTEEIAIAKDYRLGLEYLIRDLDSDHAKLAKERDSLKGELARLEEQVYKDTTNPLEWVTRWPILDALYDGNVRINQIWLPDLTINFNFSQVARFDRCKSCHQAIALTAPGTSAEPAYPMLEEEQRELTISLATPDEAPAADATVRDVYGFVIAEEGIVNYADVTVHYVLPESAAARAGLESGDVIRLAGDKPTYDPETATNYLLNGVKWGEAASLTVRRGLDHPFVSHPRLDLYLSDASPHSEKVFGCTVCHDGQGSGTSFRWTSHTPNDADQQIKWSEEFGWFDNHHWIFPMKPARFAESNCTKCHHDKGSLEPSERFPEPPAPKLVEGWTLVEKYGCFGCHEIGGFAGPDKRIGPDVRLEPNYSEVASQILQDGGLTEEQQKWAKTLIDSPDSDAIRHLLNVAIKRDETLAQNAETQEEATLTTATHQLTDGLKDVEAPGSYRKAGPSLRYLNSKVDFDWLHAWISKPSDFRPTTRMPQFFGLHEHLQDEDDADELAVSKRFEPVEIRAMAEFLLSNSNEFEYLQQPAEVTEAPSAERGKWQFESRGCLACHSHEAFTGIASDQGPDLSRVGAKFSSEKGPSWLYSWIKKPHRYHGRTKMPDLFLDPIEEVDVTGQPTGKVTDPAADIAAFLMGSASDWKPAAVAQEWSPAEQEALADLAQEWLTSDAIPTARAKKFVEQGIPDHLDSKLKSDEKLLIGINAENRLAKLQEYVARRSISKHGCFGCHDIPGFETAKPIGTPLADWGRKETSKLAFENIQKFLEGHGNPNADAEHSSAEHADEDEHASHGHLDPADFDPDTSYYIQSLNSHSRDGFIWQKLRMPRSYDYKTTRNKGYNERLRMPKFPFNKEQREAVITFVLGLVNEAPAEQFVYKPDPRQKAIVDGRLVLDRFNCAGCHTLQMEQWQLAFEEDQFDSPSEVNDFPFLTKHFDPKEIAASLKTDVRGRTHATVHGLPVMSEETGLPELFDEDGLSIEPDDDESDPYYLFTLWKDSVINGEPWLVGLQNLMIPANREGYGPADGKAYPTWGGDLARYLYPKAIARAKEINPQVKGAEAWGWLPPQLLDEGSKVQTDWLHGFLMDPTAIRPAVLMRMPNFHMSAADAEKLVNYFAAVSGAEFPYEYKPRQRESYLASLEGDRPERLAEAMNIVVNGNYCVKCHAVGDFLPQGDRATFGPNLADVYRRLRPDYVQNWVANPKRILPYTGMPVNIPFPAGISQDVYHGTSLEQLDGLVDVLMNFDVYAKRQTSVTQLVEDAKVKTAPAEEANEADEAKTEAEASTQTSDASPEKPSRR